MSGEAIPGISAYIHVPFCARKCPYCAFYSLAGEPPENHDRYLDALETELIARSRLLPPGGTNTIYIGGGTPTLLRPQALRRLLRLVHIYLAGERTSEITIEALPSTLTPEKVGIIRRAGVGRVTLGVQSTERAVLEGIARAAELDALPLAIQYLREEGISNIGIDLILGLPGETLAGFRRGLGMLRAWGCAHISAYMLYVEQGTPFAGTRPRLPHALSTRRLYTALCASLRRMGFEHYEVSNFALRDCATDGTMASPAGEVPERSERETGCPVVGRGYACQHNRATWRQESLLGFGPSAVGTLYTRGDVDGVGNVVSVNGVVGGTRRCNHASLDRYCADPLGAYTEERLSPQDIFHETLLLGLRTSDGIPEDLAFAFLGDMGALPKTYNISEPARSIQCDTAASMPHTRMEPPLHSRCASTERCVPSALPETHNMSASARSTQCDTAALPHTRTKLRRKLDGFVRSGLLTHTEGRYRASIRGMLWLDSILVDLFLDEGKSDASN
jgi:oxygen-independent coproporphyrinogen-3 oxidase